MSEYRKGAYMFGKARKRTPKVKVVRVGYGLLGRSNTRGVEKAIQKWLSKGYALSKQDDHAAHGCFDTGYTILTFIERLD